MENVSHLIVLIRPSIPFVPKYLCKACSPYLYFQMAEEGWTQGICQAAPGFPSLLINALERFGVSECPRYYSREYEHHGSLRCRVILVFAKSDRYPDIQPWRVTTTGFRYQDTYPWSSGRRSVICARFFRDTSPPHQ